MGVSRGAVTSSCPDRTVGGLTGILPHREADRVAEGTAALIDGLYIRRALKDGVPDAATAIALVEDYLETKLDKRSPQ